MKATGIVRRIDDLGRVVIPKEIRRTLRIREGAPLEIYVDRSGGLILKKYSPLKEMADLVGDYVESLNEKLHTPAFIVDHDGVVAAAGVEEGAWIQKETPEAVLECIENRKVTVLRGEEAVWSFSACAVAPIIAEGDALGAVLVVPQDEPSAELALKLAETAAGFLGRQIML